MGMVLAQTTLAASITGAPLAQPLIFDATVTLPTTGSEIVEAGVIEVGVLGNTNATIQPTLTGAVDTSIFTNAVPRDDGRFQIIGMPEVWIDSVQVPPHQLKFDGFQVTERIDGARTFSFQVAAHSDFSTDDSGGFTPQFTGYQDPLGPVWNTKWTGAPPGLESIDIYWNVALDTGFAKVQLVSDGVVDNAELQIIDGGSFWQINGSGREQRLDEQLVDFRFPPGSGTSLSNVVASIVELLPELANDTVPVFKGPRTWAGLPEFRNTLKQSLRGTVFSNPRYKEYVVKDAPGWQRANEILALSNHRIRFDRQGDLEVVFMGERPDEAPDFQLTQNDVAAPGVQFAPANDGPTSARVTAFRQIVSDTATGSKTIDNQRIEIRENTTSPETPQLKISDTSGTLVASGLNQTQSRFRTTQIVKINRQSQAGEPLAEQVWVYGWFNKERSAGLMQTDGTILFTVDRLVNDNGQAVDSAKEGWRLISLERTNWNYENVTIPSSSPSVTPTTVGVLKSIVVQKRGWYNQREQVGQFTSGGAVDWSNGQVVLFNGEGVAQTVETFRNLEIESTGFDVNPDLMLDSERVRTTKWFVPPGNKYFYASGETSQETDEDFRLFSLKRITYSGGVGSTHTKTTTTRTAGGKVVVETDVGDGFKPAAKVIDSVQKPPGFPPAKAKFTSVNDTERFEVFFQNGTLERNRQPYTVELSSDFIEDEDEATFWAEQTIKEGSAVPVSWSMPANLLLQPGHKTEIDLGRRRDNLQGKFDAYVVQVVHSISEQDDYPVATTQVEGKVYVA